MVIAAQGGIMPAFQLCFFLLGLGLLVLAAPNAAREYAAFDAARQPELRILQAGQTPLPVFPRSRHGREVLLKRCLADMTALSFPLYPPALREEIRAGCAAMAAQTLAKSPGAALAHLVRAEGFLQQGALDEAFLARDLSRENSPREGWLAGHRLRFALRAGSEPDAGAAADLSALLSGPNGARSLATLFDAHPDWQSWLIGQIETMVPEKQQLFLMALRHARGGA